MRAKHTLLAVLTGSILTILAISVASYAAGEHGQVEVIALGLEDEDLPPEALPDAVGF